MDELRDCDPRWTGRRNGACFNFTSRVVIKHARRMNGCAECGIDFIQRNDDMCSDELAEWLEEIMDNEFDTIFEVGFEYLYSLE